MKSKIGIGPVFLAFLLVFTSCDKFPRDNPIDPANTESEQADIILDEDPSIDDDFEYDVRNNGNGAIDPGETFHFVADLRNEGRETAMGVTATISSSSRCVVRATVESASGNRARYGDIESDRTSPSSELVGTFHYEVAISSDDECSAGEPVVLYLDVEDENDGSWEISIEFEIAESDAEIEIVQEEITITDDVADGVEVLGCNNNNRRIEPGETFQITIPIQNTGSSVLRGLRARLVSQAPNCVIFPLGEGETSETLSYGDLRPGLSSHTDDIEETDLPVSFLVETIIDGCLRERDFNVEMIVEDVSGRSWDPSVILPLNTRNVDIVYYQHFIDDRPDINEDNDYEEDADPGEAVYLTIHLENRGDDLAPSITLSEGEQEQPECVEELYFRNAIMDRLWYGNIDSRQQPPSPEIGYLEIVLSEDDCESGETVELVFEARDGCSTGIAASEHTWEIRVPIDID